MYVSCPLAFNFRYCLGLEEKEDLFDEPEAADVGTFVHGLLEKTYAGFMNKKPVIDERFEKLFFAEFDELFKQEFSRKMKADSFILEDILRHRMKKFLESEKQRNDIDTLVMLEKRIPWKIKTQSGIFNFTAGVDRVDKLSGGSFLVIDYKTGGTQMPNVHLDNLKPEGDGAASDRPQGHGLASSGQSHSRSHKFCREEIKNTIKSFQLPIYIWACREHLKAQDVSAAIYFLRTCEIKEYLQKSTPEKKKENLDACLKAISFILDEIVSPDVVFEADEDTEHKCPYCPYSSLCR
jgi:hypothetical protein